MYPTLLKIGPVAVHSYGLMIAIGFLLALHLTLRDAPKFGIDPQAINNMAFWALLWGIIGTRVLHIIMFPQSYSLTDPVGWIAIWRGGLVFQGALPATIVYAFYGCRKRKVPFWRTVDVVIPYLPLAHAFGRVGCFLNGCCYGMVTSLPWGVRFPRVPWDLSQDPTGSPPYLDQCQPYGPLVKNVDHWSLPVQPTQLYGVVGLLALCFLIIYLRKHWHPFDGFGLPVYFMLYSTGRFFVEFIRGDHNPTVFGFLSEQQVFCIVGLIAGLFLFLILRSYSKAESGK